MCTRARSGHWRTKVLESRGWAGWIFAAILYKARSACSWEESPCAICPVGQTLPWGLPSDWCAVNGSKL